ncbi:hypothetical protein [Hathewaya massiliensis]|uniref:hypothetical protein n=1 Tax=Hathewaya massiliensis TaxID=1964382 RepID=UPI001158450E|nr:hypothetical protein [Hathewaya massiliensis]
MKTEKINTQNKINYNIKKKDVFLSAIKQFYENKTQLFLGPVLILSGVLIRTRATKLFLPNLLIAFGVFYIMFPYTILLFNMTKVKNNKMSLELEESTLKVEDNTGVLRVKYENIEGTEEDKYYTRVMPKDGNTELLKEILIPKKSIESGDLEEFVEGLQNKLESFSKGKELFKEEYTEGKRVLRYNLSKEEYKNILKIEYYSRKKHFAYGIIFAALGGLMFTTNKGIAFSFGALACLYIGYPYLAYLLKKNTIDEEDVVIHLSKDGYIGILSSKMGVKIRAGSIKIIEDNQWFLKILIPVKKGVVMHIPKNNIKEGSVEGFLKLFPKKSFINKKNRK